MSQVLPEELEGDQHLQLYVQVVPLMFGLGWGVLSHLSEKPTTSESLFPEWFLRSSCCMEHCRASTVLNGV